MSDPRNFLSNSDYPADKIVFLKSGIVGVTKNRVAIAHGLSFTPLLDGIWRKTSDNIWYSFGTGPVRMYSPAANNSYPVSDAILLDSDPANMLFQIEDVSNPASSIEIEYRVFGFTPNESGDVLVDATADASSRLLRNSDQNYRKLLRSGDVSVANGQTQTITHGLGFIPQVEVWIGGTSDSTVRKFIDIASHESSMAQYDTYQVFVDEQTLTFKNQYDSTRKFYYRICADEVGATI